MATPEELVARAVKQGRQPTDSVRCSSSARQLREHEVDGLVQRYLEVRNIRQVAREWKMSRTTVAKHLADRGLDTSRRMSETEIANAVRLYDDGWSSIRIGQHLGFDKHTIIAALRSAGTTIRPAAASRTR